MRACSNQTLFSLQQKPKSIDASSRIRLKMLLRKTIMNDSIQARISWGIHRLPKVDMPAGGCVKTSIVEPASSDFRVVVVVCDRDRLLL
jgi:hypothetical protein